MSDSSADNLRTCPGCGSILQNSDPGLPGYVPDLNMKVCQRCFRLTHYDRNEPVKIEPMHSLDILKDVGGLFFWILDVFELETALASPFMDLFRERECYIIVNKCDLLPETVTETKLTGYLNSRLKNIRLKGYVFRGLSEGNFREQVLDIFVDHPDQDYVMVGIANAGKSTVINDILGRQILTVNRHPSTTLQLNPLETEYGTIVDTVGLVTTGSVTSYLRTKDLKLVVPNARIKPTVFQLKGSQTLSIAGLARLDILDCEKVTAVAYLSNLCPITRSNHERADQFWEKHYGKDLRPYIRDCEKFSDFKEVNFSQIKNKRDICIEGLGWICISGKYSGIKVFTDPRIRIRNRKAMI